MDEDRPTPEELAELQAALERAESETERLAKELQQQQTLHLEQRGNLEKKMRSAKDYSIQLEQALAAAQVTLADQEKALEAAQRQADQQVAAAAAAATAAAAQQASGEHEAALAEARTKVQQLERSLKVAQQVAADHERELAAAARRIQVLEESLATATAAAAAAAAAAASSTRNAAEDDEDDDDDAAPAPAPVAVPVAAPKEDMVSRAELELAEEQLRTIRQQLQEADDEAEALQAELDQVRAVLCMFFQRWRLAFLPVFAPLPAPLCFPRLPFSAPFPALLVPRFLSAFVPIPRLVFRRVNGADRMPLFSWSRARRPRPS